MPTLVLNRRFVVDLLAEAAPCIALGMISERGQDFACFALHLDTPLPPDIAAAGFALGHCLLGTDDGEAIQFSFAFSDVATYNVLLNPSNLGVQIVVEDMLTHGGYFILLIGQTGEATVFRADLGPGTLEGLKANQGRLLGSTTTAAHYAALAARFRAQPSPPGQWLAWVCRDSAA
ncbi:hypothetical protein CKO23_24510, partial [Thiocystis violacea]|nr:hypothetical protein [Thiocystis violacea]